MKPAKEAFHVRSTHWVPASGGTCPASHPNLLKNPDGDGLRCYTAAAAAAVRRALGAEQLGEQERDPSAIQTLIFSKEEFDKASALAWAKEHDFKVTKEPDVTEDTIRIRQVPPERFQDGTLRTIDLSDGVKAVVGRLKMSMSEQEKQGLHEHPHDEAGGVHDHLGLPPATGGHLHTDENPTGLHRHRPDDPLEGGHDPEGDGDHDHPKALELLAQECDLLEGIRPAFGSPGGKRFLAKKIVAIIPDHKSYVEPFIGGGAVFFAKKPSAREVISDKSGDIVAAYRFIKAVSEKQIEALNGKPLAWNREIFEQMKSKVVESDVDRFHKFMYLNRFHYGAQDGNSQYVRTAGSMEGRTLKHLVARLPKLKERLAKVSIRAGDFRRMLRENDSPTTFFYLDPPYPDKKRNPNMKTGLTNRSIASAVKKLRGKFLLSMPDTRNVRSAFSFLRMRSVKVRRTIDMKTTHFDSELLISNYPMRTSGNWMA